MAYSFPEADQCGYCAEVRSGTRNNFLVAESEHAAVVVPEWMRTHGAVIVLPRAHATSFLELADRQAAGLFELAQHAAAAVTATLDPDGLHFWWDTGLFVGQTEPHHFIEVVPRYRDEPYKYQPIAALPRRTGSERAAAAALLRDPLRQRQIPDAPGSRGGGTDGT
jgi:diadenosine tetraphosphate (Ap4A) HIT family hydrolase